MVEISIFFHGIKRDPNQEKMLYNLLLEDDLQGRDICKNNLTCDNHTCAHRGRTKTGTMIEKVKSSHEISNMQSCLPSVHESFKI